MLRKPKMSNRSYGGSLLYCYYYNLEYLAYLESLRDEKAQLLDNISNGHGINYEYKVSNTSFNNNSKESNLVIQIASIEKDIEYIKQRIKFYEEKENLAKRIKSLRDKDKFYLHEYFVLNKSCKEIALENNCNYKTVERRIRNIFNIIGDVSDYGEKEENI